jgi:succinate dehydrogenase/fumarate reductase flavoprotein subunit
MATGDNHYDYLIIGAGSGGIASAKRAAGYGAKVCTTYSPFPPILATVPAAYSTLLAK